MEVEEMMRNGGSTNCYLLLTSPEKTVLNEYTFLVEANGDCVKGNSLSVPDKGFLTYKRRRKCSRDNTGRNMPRVAEDSGNREHHIAAEKDDKFLCNGSYEQFALSVNGGPICMENDADTNLSSLGDCKNILEQILKSPNLSKDGVLPSIQDALTICKQMVQSEEPTQSQINMQFPRLQKYYNRCPTPYKFQKELNDETAAFSITNQCRNALCDILASEEFASLCSFLCKNFPGTTADHVLDLSKINSRMKNGAYEDSSGLFALDIHRLWENIRKIGEEMSLLAHGLSKVSRTSYKERVRNLSDGTTKERNCVVDQENNCILKKKCSAELGSQKHTIPLACDQRNRTHETQDLCLYQTCTCRQCGLEANGSHSLVCDGCEAMYHISCIKPGVHDIPTRNWYCSSCVLMGKNSPGTVLSDGDYQLQHENCVICNKLYNLEIQKKNLRNETHISIHSNSEEISDLSIKSENPDKSEAMPILRVCKICKKSESSGRFRICGNPGCISKYYHNSCLTFQEMKIHSKCWYCPSCLCRACLTDKDDNKIVLCDHCDQAYHTYCTTPPLSTIPTGKWYCSKCISSKENGNASERCFTKRRSNSNRSRDSGCVDMLLNAAEKLWCEEKRQVVEARNR